MKQHYSPIPHTLPENEQAQIMSLKNVLAGLTIGIDSPALIDEMKSRLETKYEKAVMQVHRNTICQLKDGRWKTKNPQIAKQTRLELLEALYTYYYGKALYTVEELFVLWIDEFKKDTLLGHRSILTHDRFLSDWDRFYKGTSLASMDVTTIKVSHIKSFYKEITAGGAIARSTLTNAKTLLNHIFDYAVDHDYVPYNVARSVNTRDLHCKEVDNDYKVYTDKERELVLKQAEKENDVHPS